MSVQMGSGVFGKDGDEFGAHDIALNGGHEGKPAGRLGGCENGPDRLHNFSSRKRNERISHISDERI